MRIGEPLSRSLRAPDLLDAVTRVLAGEKQRKPHGRKKYQLSAGLKRTLLHSNVTAMSLRV